MRRPTRPTNRQQRKVLDATEVGEFTPSTHVETLRERMDCGVFTAVGWIPPANLSDDSWARTGAAILAIERATAWCWGDWWLARGYRTLPAGWNGPALSTLDNSASVSREYDISRRRENVSFKHHAELASLRKPEQDELLDWCETDHRSVTELRAERRRRAAARLPPPNPPRIEPPRTTPPQPPAPARVESPGSAPPRPLIEPPDVAIRVELFLPEDLHTWATEAAASEDMSLAGWIIRQIERARE